MIREKHSHRKSLPVELCEKELQDEREEDNSDACAHSVDKEENGDANALRENKDGKNALFEVEGGKNYDEMNALFECITYILYRRQREKLRNTANTIIDFKTTIDDYLKINDWRVNAFCFSCFFFSCK